MPVENNIELGSGTLYFNGTDESVEVSSGSLTCAEEEFADDTEYISMNTEAVEFECEADFNREWTLVKCCRCGSNMPVTEFWALRAAWVCGN